MIEITETHLIKLNTVCHINAAMSDFLICKALNTILYVAEHGCKWRTDYPNTVATGISHLHRINRWAKSSVLNRTFKQLQKQIQFRLDHRGASFVLTSPRSAKNNMKSCTLPRGTVYFDKPAIVITDSFNNSKSNSQSLPLCRTTKETLIK